MQKEAYKKTRLVQRELFGYKILFFNRKLVKKETRVQTHTVMHENSEEQLNNMNVYTL